MNVKHFFKLGEFFSYFVRVFRKNDGTHPNNINLRMMHGINKISILMFLFALIVIVARYIYRSM